MTLREATHAFLLKDYAVSVRHASDVMATVSPAEVPWFDRLDQQPDEATDEHRRKTLLLLITLSASIWSSESLALSKATQLSPTMDFILAARPSQPVTCLRALRKTCLSLYGPPDDLSRLPPSIVAALTLAALKLNLVQEGRKLVDDWDSSLSEDARQLLAEESQALQESRSLESSVQSLADRRTLSSSENLEDSTTLATSRVRGAVQSYERLMDTCCLAILPRLGDWQGARDRIDKASYANGGILSQAKAEALHASLAKQKKRRETDEQQRSKQAEMERARTATPAVDDPRRSKSRSARRSPRPADSKKSSGSRKGSSSSSLSGGDPSSASPHSSPDAKAVLKIKGSTEAPPSGFASLRYTLARFIAPHQPTDEDRQLSSAPTTLASLRYMLSFAVLRLRGGQVFRSVLLAAFIVVMLQRRARDRLRRAALLSWAKIVQTVKLGTSVSQL